MGAYGPPRACDCMKAYATLLCYFNYDGWHSSYEMKCPACWLPLITWGETSAVAAIWDGTQWRQPARSDEPTDPQPGAPVNPPAFLPPTGSSCRTRRRPTDHAGPSDPHRTADVAPAWTGEGPPVPEGRGPALKPPTRCHLGFHPAPVVRSATGVR